MIYLYSGSPGSGKSLAMAKEIYWHVKMKRPVVANFDINRDMFKDTSSFTYLDTDEFKPQKLVEISQEYFKKHPYKEGAINLYWDEAQINLNSRDWRNNSEWIEFFTQHRKYGYDVVLVAQHHEMLDKQVRAVIEYETMHRKVNNVGLFGKIVGLFTFGHPVIVGVTRWYGMKMKLASHWSIGVSKYYRLYDTRAIFQKG